MPQRKEQTIKRRFKHCALNALSTLNSGFSLLEVLLVIVVIGVLMGMGISAFSGVIKDTAADTLSGELNGFFNVCRLRAKMRQTPLTIAYDGGYLYVKEKSTLRQKLKLNKQMAEKLFTNFTVGTDGVFYREKKAVDRLEIKPGLGEANAPTILIKL